MHQCVNGCIGLAWIGVEDRAICPRCGGSVREVPGMAKSVLDALNLIRVQVDPAQNHYGPSDVIQACRVLRLIPRERVKVTLDLSPERLESLIDEALRSVGVDPLN